MPDVISPELRQVLRRLKLSPVLATLPERLTLARQQKLPHQDFLELLLADEVSRRDQIGAQQRAQQARLDPQMTLEAWDDTSKVRFDRQLWNELCSLRFLEEAASVLILGPVGVGKTMLATTLGHIACRRHHTVLFYRTDQLLKRLKASRLDASFDQELRRLLRVDLLILDDFGLHALDAQETADVYEIVVERFRRSSMVLTSNREPQEWLSIMGDPLLAQSAVDRLVNSSFELVLEGESYRRRQKPTRGKA